ncbi:MAG: hypothetical protein U0Q16_11945 [Bryobacteraceae bacterium]
MKPDRCRSAEASAEAAAGEMLKTMIATMQATLITVVTTCTAPPKSPKAVERSQQHDHAAIAASCPDLTPIFQFPSQRPHRSAPDEEVVEHVQPAAEESSDRDPPTTSSWAQPEESPERP